MDPKYLALIVYVGCGILFTLLVKSQSKDPNYDPLVIAMSVEFTKLVAATIYFFFSVHREKPISESCGILTHRWPVARWFFLPAVCYACFNALQYVNLNLVNPGTYRIVINTKVLWSGLMLWVFFGQRLTIRQWLALVLLMVAVGLEQFGHFDWDTGILALSLLIVQAWCSSLGGVAFQWLLQMGSDQVDLWEKNIYLYSWGVLFNICYLIIARPSTLNPFSLMEKYWSFALIIFISASTGLATSLLLKHFDVIIKEYANFVELCGVALGAYFWLGLEFHSSLFISIIMVSVSLYLYNSAHAPPPVPTALTTTITKAVTPTEETDADRELELGLLRDGTRPRTART